MSIKITINNLEKVERLFTELKKNVKPQIIDRSLDTTLTTDLTKLKAELLNTLNNEIKSKVTIQEQQGRVEDVTMKKSDQEMLKHITGVDLSKVSATRDFNTLADGKVAIVSNKTMQKANIDRMNVGPTSKMSSGVNLRLPMSEADTFENQHAQALNYYNQAVFVFVDNGKTSYYMNPGIDMSQYVKVVCSKDAGNTERSQNRWGKHRDKRGYADWSLLVNGLDRIKSDFINITDVIEKLKEGSYEDARGVLNRVSQKANNTSSIFDKIEDLKDKKKLDGSVESYNNLVRLVKNLKLEKSVKSDRTFYTLVSTYDENAPDYQNFQEKITQEVKIWKIGNEQRWVEVLLKSTVGLVEKLLR